jgi:acetyl-CoA synthetase
VADRSVGRPIKSGSLGLSTHKFIGGEKCPVVDTWWQTKRRDHDRRLSRESRRSPGSASRPFPGIFAEIRTESGEKVEVGGGLLR